MGFVCSPDRDGRPRLSVFYGFRITMTATTTKPTNPRAMATAMAVDTRRDRRLA